MKQLLLILFLASIITNSFSQTNCDIIEEYQKIFKIKKKQYGEREYLMKSVNKLDNDNCFSDLINNNIQYTDYLLTNFSDNSNYEKLMAINDSIELQNEFIRSLKNDSTFNSVIKIMTDKIANKSEFIPDTVSMNELLNIAVKYFSITRINKEGNFIGQVCTGRNNLKQTEKIRKPQIEAFCFSSILNNYQGEDFNMYNEFVKGIKELYKINLGIDNEERLLRAQGAMFILMKNNKNLKELLISEFEKKKTYLPFVLEPQNQ
ncbi:MAG: hypothetical protein U9R19_04605 [Bacteroidota bacterium]|nr:hypothetical protein [Bacteroidota bacterium]